MPLALHSLTLSDIATIEAAIDALEADVVILDSEVDILERNVRDIISINMGADDYTLTEEESQALVITVTNEGVGKTIYFPTATDSTRGGIQYIVTIFCTNSFTVANESGGTTAELPAGSMFQISSSAAIGGVLNATTYTNINARGKSNGVRIISGTSGNITDADKGMRLICTNPLLTTLTILSTITTFDFVCNVCAAGAAGVAIVGDGTSTPSINTTLVTKQSTEVCKDAATQNFYCI